MTRKALTAYLFLTAALCGSLTAKADVCNGFSNNLVANCGFETGSFSGWSGSATTDPFSGIDTGDPFAIGKTPYQGTYEAFLGTVGSTSTLSQSLVTTPGSNYLIEFALLNDASNISPYSNSFALTFGGATLFSESNAAASPYTLYSFSGAANSSTTTLSFTDRNDVGDFELDSVSVVAQTPEPSSLFLLGTGLGALLGLAGRRSTTDQQVP